MSLLFIIGCVIASFFFMTFLVVIFDSLLAKLNLSSTTPFWHVFNALLSGGVAFSAGYFAAWLPLYLGGNIEDSLQSVVGLVMLTGAMSFVCFCGSFFAKSTGGEPMWFHLVLFIVSNIGIMQGGAQLIPSSLMEQQQYFILNFISHFQR